MATKAQLEELKQLCENDLYTFAQWVNPGRVYGQLHKEMFDFITKEDATPNQLLLIPRAHMKSHVIAVWAAWWITKNPETTILYLSATATLAEAQLYTIKNILTSKQYSQLWPEMINKEEGKREVWRTNAISVDHPKRKEEGVRDYTVVTAGITTNTTGLHADVIIPDDVVVPDNAFTEDGRGKVARAMSQMASIKNTGGITKAVGTRYHPKDQYNTWLNQKMKVFDENDEIVGEEAVWEVMEKVVEENGQFLWPRTQREDGKWFGFNRRELSRIEAEYTDRAQFFSQYYNNPNDPSNDRISRDKFQYYEPRFLKSVGGIWEMSGKRLNVYASIDFAFSLGKKADSTAIVVIGINSEGQIYILDIDRFKADKISTYFEHLAQLHDKWNFRKLRAEVSVAQALIVRDLKDMITKNGMVLSIDEFRPSRNEGTKEERIAAALEHKYENSAIWHYRGGYTNILEDELVMNNPPHDDIKDALASAVEIAVKPMQRSRARDSNIIQMGGGRFGAFG
jgi:hypothetical protein